MEESAISRLCKALSSILTIFTQKQALPKPEMEIRQADSISYVDEKHQIEKKNLEQNAIDKDPE